MPRVWPSCVRITKASIDKDDLTLLFNLLVDFHPDVVLEIGSWKGYSAKLWQAAFDPSLIISIEKDRENFASLVGTFKWIYGDSHDPSVWGRVAASLHTIQHHVDFLFIDGDHSYEGVRQDWKDYQKFLSQKSVVVFHDTHYVSNDPNAPVQVHDLWEEIKYETDSKWVEIKMKNSTGMGILFYGSEW